MTTIVNFELDKNIRKDFFCKSRAVSVLWSPFSSKAWAEVESKYWNFDILIFDTISSYQNS